MRLYLKLFALLLLASTLWGGTCYWRDCQSVEAVIHMPVRRGATTQETIAENRKISDIMDRYCSQPIKPKH